MSYDVWQAEVKHEGLHKYRLIRGRDRYVVEQKAKYLRDQWNEMWQKNLEKVEYFQSIEDKKQIAEERNKEAKRALDEVATILHYTLNINDAVNWEAILDKSGYPIKKPIEPVLKDLPIEPKKTDSRFKPKINFFTSLLGWKEERIKEANDFFEKEHASWEHKKQETEESDKKLMLEYQEKLIEWEQKRNKFIEVREKKNAQILAHKERYLKKETGAIVDYCELVLSNSKYPETFPQQFELDYEPDTKRLLVDYFLPSKEDIPTLKEVKYIKATDEFKESHISESIFNNLYDSVLYEITLRTIHELYEADVINALSFIIFNGYVKFIDKGTGKEVTSCILSIQASRDEFININLANVEPKACFKALKGIGSSKLHGLAPVAPIMKMNKEDKRFINAYSVVGEIDDTTNIAAMDWQDFEHLIRELFEKEFSPQGGEVKITQASRDEGVDAVIFDPDPLRGGKIVIQAKRYTNVVGVSAVRDLYGTVMNEGAMKGILVTTSEYGPDAYNFAKDKPLTLLNGSNLLHLLEKHGHKAKIDIKEAKKILLEREKEDYKNIP